MPEILTDLAFNILLSLTDGELHGYALVKRLRALEGRSSLRTGTVYAALARLEDEGWIESVDGPRSEGQDRRRRYYAISEQGLITARAEATRLSEIVDRARTRALLSDSSHA